MIPRIIDYQPCHSKSDDAGLRASGKAYTAVVGEEIIGSAGIVRLWDGVGEAWVEGWNRTPTLAVWFHRTVKKMLKQVITEMKLWRVQAKVPQSDLQAREWIKRLGFLEESALFHYLPEGGHAVSYYMIVRENLP